jgi:protein TonB
MSLLLCGALFTAHTAHSKVSQDSLTQQQAKAQTFNGKIVSQNGVRFVLRDDDDNSWYHLDDQEKAGKLVGKDVLVTGTFDGLTGTIRVQSIVESPPHPKAAANTEELHQNSEPAKEPAKEPTKDVAAPPPTADAVAPAPQQPTSVQLHQPQAELSNGPAPEAPAPSSLALPEEAVSSSSSIAISSRRSVPMPSGFNPETQSSKNLLAGRLLKHVAPSYPPEAMQQRIEGTVQLHAVISDDGNVLSLEPVSGPPLLVEAAVIAVRQWRYGPTLFDGHRTQVHDDVRLIFRLPN